MLMEIVCADPQAGTEQRDPGDQPGCSPPDDCGFSVCPMNVQYNLIGSETRIFYVALHLAAKFGGSLVHLLSQTLSSTGLCLLHGFGEFRDSGMHFFR